MSTVRDAMKKTRQPDREAAFQRKSFLRFLGRRANPSDTLGRACMGLYERLKLVHDDTTVGPRAKQVRFAKILAEYSEAYMKENFRDQYPGPGLAQVKTDSTSGVDAASAPTEDTRSLGVQDEPVGPTPDDEHAAGSDGLGSDSGDRVQHVGDEVSSRRPLIWCELCGSRHTKEFGDEFHDRVTLPRGEG